ncbi:protein translocase SEC61 complex subunit gamma [Candidatus Woesearchaeota archaeon]|nr:protein translocase SEC61 complex subunit gamma [Candidatus Woesearchaeota archaeon]
MDVQPQIPQEPQQIPAQVPVPEITQQPQPVHVHHHSEPKAPSKWQERWTRLKEFVKECKRVLAVTKKPNAEELRVIVKISGIGILLIGLIGFLIHFAREGMRFVGF